VTSSGEDPLALLLDRSHRLQPADLPGAVVDAVHLVGGTDVALLLVDLAQELLVPFGLPDASPVDIDGTLAGRAYRTNQPVVVAESGGTKRAWFPLLDGSERLGVMGVSLPTHDDDAVRRCMRIAGLTGELVVTKAQYGDAIHLVRRSKPLTLAAELRWTLLPPLTFETVELHIAAILEPSYSVAGDTFDYSVDPEVAHVAVFDAMGHGLEAARIANLVTGAYRHARRTGQDLLATYETITRAVDSEFDPSRFSTGALARLEVGSGRLHLLLAGHPPPLLLRHHQVVGELECRPTTPLGILDPDPFVATIQLEPDDRVILYTDGVVEARRPNGDDFGLERLADFLVRAEASGEPPAETMRRLAKAVLAHQEGQLQDDASLLMVHWRPE
jgi:hypothetical protein